MKAHCSLLPSFLVLSITMMLTAGRCSACLARCHFNWNKMPQLFSGIVPRACATETMGRQEEISSYEQMLSDALQSKSTQWNSFSLAASVRGSVHSLWNSTNCVGLISSVLRQSLLEPRACFQGPCELFQSNVFKLHLSSVMPLACFARLPADHLNGNATQSVSSPGPVSSVSTNLSPPEFNLWTTDSFTIDGRTHGQE